MTIDEQFDEYRSQSVISGDSVSFHTPEPYDLYSQDEGEEEDVHITVEVSALTHHCPLEATATNSRYRSI